MVTLGVCVGFLPWNVHPARIFMGDCGALMLGVLMAASTMSVGGSTDAVYSGQSFFFLAPLFIPLVILGVPILDTLFAIVRRASRRSGMTTADKEHLHHRLLRLGHGHRRAVFILWLWTALLSGAVLFPALTNRGDALVPARPRRPRPQPLHGVPPRGPPAREAATSGVAEQPRPTGLGAAVGTARLRSPPPRSRAPETMDLRRRNPVF